jgi:hypothetical protein
MGDARTQSAALKERFPATLGVPSQALKISVNLSRDVGNQLKRIAYEENVSESSVIEIALRQLFRRVSSERLGAFLKENGACLRRRS